ncbi:DUF6998 domain-containing protein [Sandarakinorhabdus oryzae]|uniref:DUF6998 domain-containing protein n=1 Tax=Sandarakinorhabdus oryzae TaxID=2675220 RepID=UPI0012E28591|nr:hypothetical protein [Sandarakinorhabdus oryzae]
MPADWIELPDVLKNFVSAHEKVKLHYKGVCSERLKFTLDGNFVGDLGEVLAIEYFDLKLGSRNSEGVDGKIGDRTVQVKATGTRRGPAFRKTKLNADHLLFFEIDFGNSRAHVVYNGPEEPVRALLAARRGNGQKSLSLAAMEKLDLNVQDADRLPMLQTTLSG